MEERRSRSLVKAGSWRITATFTTVVIAWLVTGQMEFAISIGVIEFFVKMFLFYFHERLWLRIKMGRIPPEYQI